MQVKSGPPAAGKPIDPGVEEDLYNAGRGVVAARSATVAETPERQPPVPQKLLKVKLEINGVGLELEASEVNVTEFSVCCVLPASAVTVRLPASRDVRLDVDGRQHQVSFVGGWHSLPRLGVTVVVFPRSIEAPG